MRTHLGKPLIGDFQVFCPLIDLLLQAHTGFLNSRGHFVEFFGERLELVARLDLHPVVQIPLRNESRAGLQSLDRLDHSSGKSETGHNGQREPHK